MSDTNNTVNKVILGDEVLMDITDSTVNTNNLLKDEVAYASNGARVVGSVEVPSELNDLSDVNISTPTNNQVLTYDSADKKWKAKNSQGGSGGSVTIVDNLFSESATDGLSANQGRVLDGKISAESKRIDYVFDYDFATKNRITFGYKESYLSRGLTLRRFSNGAIEVSGTPTSDFSGSLDYIGGYYLKAGTYILSDGDYSKDRVEHENLYLQVEYNTDSNSVATARCLNGSIEFTTSGGTTRLYLCSTSSTKTDAQGTLYPMIRSVEFEDSTFQTGAKSNLSLTAEYQGLSEKTYTHTRQIKSSSGSEGLYDSTDTYSKDEVVWSEARNGYYIAIQDVPTGIDTSNTSYWKPISLRTLEQEITEISTDTFNANTSTVYNGSFVQIFKQLEIKVIRGYIKAASGTGMGWIDLCTIDEKYRPKYSTIYGTIPLDATNFVKIRFYQNGLVQARMLATTTKEITGDFSLTYI